METPPEYKGKLNSRFKEAAQKHTDSHCPGRIGGVAAQSISAYNSRKVEKDGSETSGRKNLDAVKHTLEHRRDRDEGQVGKHHPGKNGGLADVLYPEKGNYPGGEEHPQAHNQGYKDRKEAEDAGKEFLCFLQGGFVTAFEKILFEDRYKGYRDRTFGKEAAEKVGYHKGNAEGIGQGAGTHEGGLGHLPEHPQDTGKQG
jgi:hypothetical protein